MCFSQAFTQQDGGGEQMAQNHVTMQQSSNLHGSSLDSDIHLILNLDVKKVS
jgi:hypothetical protein